MQLDTRVVVRVVARALLRSPLPALAEGTPARLFVPQSGSHRCIASAECQRGYKTWLGALRAAAGRHKPAPRGPAGIAGQGVE